jgi:copper(I)-binding protein
VRPTAPGTAVSAGYLKITNTVPRRTCCSAPHRPSPNAWSCRDDHERDGVSSMRPLPGLAIAPGASWSGMARISCCSAREGLKEGQTVW